MSMTMLNVPVGTVIDFAGPTAPDGYLECDGSAISRTTYAVLFSIIGTSWGTGDGSTTFNLPDLRGRTTIGVGTGTAGGATAHAFASTGGDERMPSHGHGYTNPTVKLPNHTHAHTNPTVTLPNHTHSISAQSIGSSGSHGHQIKYDSTGASGSAKAIISTNGSKTTSKDCTPSGGSHTHTLAAHDTNNPKSLPNCSVSGGSVGNPSSLPNCTVSGGGVSSNGDGTAGNMQPFATLKKLIRAA